jgi:hypothetical protein
VGKILSNYSDNGGAAKTYGSLGMTSLYGSLKSLVPGFVLPIAIENSGDATLAAKLTAKPLNFDMDTALEAVNDPK